MTDEHKWKSLKRGLKQPQRTMSILKDDALEINGRIYDLFQESCDVLSEDWDTLLILDACRYDIYSEQCTIEGNLQSRTSAGSNSAEFLDENFAGRQAHDTVYISGNPYTYDLPPETFHKVENLFLSDWDEDLETVHPSVVTERAIEAHNQWPQKRHIVHYMQPHYPFIGDTGQDLDHRGFNPDSISGRIEDANIWERLARGEVNKGLVWKAYRENLNIVLKYAYNLVEEIDGKVVISSDHGNLVGDITLPIPVRGHDHPGGVHVKELVKVPWHVISQSNRRTVVSEPPQETESVDDETIKKRLNALGYR